MLGLNAALDAAFPARLPGALGLAHGLAFFVFTVWARERPDRPVSRLSTAPE